MTNKRFGMLTVKSVYTDDKYKKCRCVCDCGNETDVFYNNLISGRTVSCGCKGRQIANRYKELKGKKYNDLIVVSKTDKRKDGMIVWKCKCLKCGNYTEATKRQLDRNYIKDCGNHKYDDLIGKQIGELKVKSFDTKKDKYFCECSCGRKTYVSRGNLISKHTLSCGHLKYERKLNYVEGVLPYMLTKKRPVNNTSGYKGISKTQKGRWIAYIDLKGKRYSLGSFSDKKDAIKARKKAEKNLFEPILEKHNKEIKR